MMPQTDMRGPNCSKWKSKIREKKALQKLVLVVIYFEHISFEVVDNILKSQICYSFKSVIYFQRYEVILSKVYNKKYSDVICISQ